MGGAHRGDQPEQHRRPGEDLVRVFQVGHRVFEATAAKRRRRRAHISRQRREDHLVGLQGPHEEVLVVRDVNRLDAHVEPVSGPRRGKRRQGFENLGEIEVAANVVAVCVPAARHEPQSVGDALAQRLGVRPVAT